MVTFDQSRIETTLELARTLYANPKFKKNSYASHAANPIFDLTLK